MSQWSHDRSSAELTPRAASIPYAAVVRPQLERDRRGGLVAFGIVSILIGALAVFFAALSSFVVMMSMTRVGKTPLWPLLVAPLIHAAAATLFIWVGIASVRCKRWVRPVVMSFGWPALIGGVMGVAGCLLLAKEVKSPPQGLNATTIMAALFTFFGIVIPAPFLWFYSTAAVRKTLAAYDPSPSWSERPALPVFLGSVNLILGGLMTLSLATVGAAPAPASASDDAVHRPVKMRDAPPERRKAAAAESDKDGKLVKEVISQFLKPTDYSPLK